MTVSTSSPSRSGWVPRAGSTLGARIRRTGLRRMPWGRSSSRPATSGRGDGRRIAAGERGRSTPIRRKNQGQRELTHYCRSILRRLLWCRCDAWLDPPSRSAVKVLVYVEGPSIFGWWSLSVASGGTLDREAQPARWPRMQVRAASLPFPHRPGAEQRHPDLVSGFSLHGRGDVAVEIREEGGVGVAQAFGGHLGCHSGSQTGTRRCLNYVECL